MAERTAAGDVPPDHVPPGSFLTEGRLDRLRRGDEDAWRDLVAEVSPLILHWFGQMSVRVQDRDDLRQDVFARAVAAIPSYQGRADGPAFRTWLYTLTRSARVDALRRAGRRVDTVSGRPFLATLARSGASPEAPEEGNPLAGINAARLERALAILRRQVRPRTYEVFQAMMLDGASPQELSARFDLRPVALRMMRQRLIRRLRTIVEDIRVA